MSREPKSSGKESRPSRWSSPARMTLSAFCLLTLQACGHESTRLVVPEPPPTLMLPPTRLSSLELKPTGATLQLSDIERQHRAEAELCGVNEERLIALQRWLEGLK